MMDLENVDDVYPLSPMQLGMVYHSIADSGSSAFVEQACCVIRGRLRVDALEKAWATVVGRHSALRTIFLWDGLDEPLQVVRSEVVLPLTQHDWKQLSEHERESRFDELLASDRELGFDLSRAPLMRVQSVSDSDSLYRMVWSFHHAILDGWSALLVVKEVFAEYASICDDDPGAAKAENFNFRRYLDWLASHDIAQDEAFWREYLSGFDARTPLVSLGRERDLAAKGRDQEDAAAHSRVSKFLSSEATSRLRVFATKQRLTLSTLIQGAWAIMLSRYAREEDVVYGATVAGRPAELMGIESAVGLFINTLPMRIHVRGDDDLGEMLRTLQSQQLQLQEVQHSSLADVQRWSELPSGESLFDSIVVVENLFDDFASDARRVDVEVSELTVVDESNYPLALLVTPGDKLEIKLVYDVARFDSIAAERMLDHLATLLDSFAQGSDAGSSRRRIAELTMLGESERQEILAARSTGITQPPFFRHQTIHQWIDDEAEQCPKAIAVRDQQGQLSYQELVLRSDALASRLRRFDVGTGDLVGLCVGRHCDMIVGILGILKAGGGYVPLDPKYPEAHLRDVVQDAGMKFVVTTKSHAESVPDIVPKVIAIDGDTDINEHNEISVSVGTPEDLAYVIYTSGSTGTPKGVLVSHGNLMHSTSARFNYYPKRVGRFLLLSSFAFDSSVAGIFWSLCSGGTLVLPPERMEQDVASLVDLIDSERITHLLCLPSLYSLILQFGNRQQLESLETVIVAGEACPSELSRIHFRQLPNTTLYNEYGPTEASVWSTVYQLRQDETGRTIPIGKPIANTEIVLLDHHDQLAPRGALGEILIGGPGVTMGYLNQDALNAEHFVHLSMPHANGSRYYRTGDLGYFLPDGNLVFAGRTDGQVKVRGFRIELGEIEDVLKRHPDVEDAAVVVCDTRQVSRATESMTEDSYQIESLNKRLQELNESDAMEHLERAENAN